MVRCALELQRELGRAAFAAHLVRVVDSSFDGSVHPLTASLAHQCELAVDVLPVRRLESCGERVLDLGEPTLELSGLGDVLACGARRSRGIGQVDVARRLAQTRGPMALRGSPHHRLVDVARDTLRQLGAGRAEAHAR